MLILVYEQWHHCDVSPCGKTATLWQKCIQCRNITFGWGGGGKTLVCGKQPAMFTLLFGRGHWEFQQSIQSSSATKVLDFVIVYCLLTKTNIAND